MKYLMCAKKFPVYHRRAGELTGFKDSIFSGRKIHTLRRSAGNRWCGDVVSLREWEGRPYASRQIEFAQCKITLVGTVIRGLGLDDSGLRKLAWDDGFDDPLDFVHWFTEGESDRVNFVGVTIYFHDVKRIGGAK